MKAFKLRAGCGRAARRGAANSVRRWLLCMGVLLGLSDCGAAAIRVAVMDFTCEDRSHRSAVAAADFTALVQANLRADPSFELVERAELARAQAELALAPAGGRGRADAVRSGRWLRADWAVFGRFSTNRDNARELLLELVDLAHAEPLAGTNLIMSATRGPLRVGATNAAAAATALGELLSAGSSIRSAESKQLRVVVRPFTVNARGIPPPGWGSLIEPAIQTSLASQPVKLVSFSRAGRGADEADLALTGLTESDSRAALRAADYFVWGELSAELKPRLDPVSRRFVWETNVTVTAWLWDGRSAPVGWTNSALTNPAPEKFGAAVAGWVLPKLVPPPNEPPDEAIRSAIADRWVDEALANLRTGISLSSPESLAMWFQTVQALEVACFIAPGNGRAREVWTRVRFNAAVEYDSRSRFQFLQQRAAAWGRQVELFGFAGATNLPRLALRERNVVGEYLDSISQVWEERDDDGRPNDWGGREYGEWHRGWSVEAARRWLKARAQPELGDFATVLRDHLLPSGYEPPPLQAAGERLAALQDCVTRFPRKAQRGWPAVADQLDRVALERLCREGGRPELKDYLLAASLPREAVTAAPPVAAAPGEPAATHRGPVRVPLPRIAVLDEPEAAREEESPFGLGQAELRGLRPPATNRAPLNPVTGHSPVRETATAATDLLVAARPDLSPPPADVELDFLEFPPLAAHSVNQLVLAGGRPWFLAQGVEEVTVTAADEQLARTVKPATTEFTRLWSVAADGRRAERAVAPTAPSEPWALAARAGEIWLGFERGGVGRLRLADGDWQMASNGLAAPSVSSLAAVGDSLFLHGGGFWELKAGAGGWRALPSPGPGFEFGVRLSPADGELVAGGRALLWWNPATESWRSKALAEAGYVSAVAGGSTGWTLAAGNAGLIGIARSGAQFAAHVEAPITLPAPFFARMGRQASQPPQVRAREEEQQLGMLLERMGRRARHRSIPGRVPGAVTALTADGDVLWVASQDHAGAGSRHLLAALRMSEQRWLGSFRVPYQPRTLAAAGDTLWIGFNRVESNGRRSALARVEVGSLLRRPRDQWVSLNGTTNELAFALAGFPERERAVYALFHDDPEVLVRHLGGKAAAELTAEDLFLLAAAHDADGRQQPAEVRRFADRLVKEYPGTLFARAVPRLWPRSRYP